MAAPKINKNWLLLAAAIALGGGAVYLSNSLIRGRIAQLEADSKKGQETVSVVVAKRDLAVGEAISAADMATRDVPKQFVHHTAITPDKFSEMERERLAIPIKRGETLLSGHTEGKGANVFSARVRPGARALTVEVDAVSSISGMLRPGDRIDLIYSGKAFDSREELTLPLLSNVTVLATVQMLSKRNEHDTNRGDRSFSTMTIEVSPEDADRVIVAKSEGKLTAVLRHPDDRDPNRTKVYNADMLLAGANASTSVIEYLVGGGGNGAITTEARKSMR